VVRHVVFEFPELRRLRGVDCTTPKCCANAYGTGQIVRSESPRLLLWSIAFHCPDCDDEMLIGSPAVDALVAQLLAEAPARHAEIVAQWVAPRIGDAHPCR
jgi:hypothetical protein